MNQGALTLTDSVLKQNVSDAEGGGIHSIGALTVSRSSFLNNSGGQTGGGIYQVGGQSTIENCIFTRNIANNGGGLSNLSSTMNVIGSLFSANTAVEQDLRLPIQRSHTPAHDGDNSTVRQSGLVRWRCGAGELDHRSP